MCIDTDTRTKVNSKLSKLDDEAKQNKKVLKTYFKRNIYDEMHL